MAKKITTEVKGDSRETFVSIRKSFSEGNVHAKLRTLYELQMTDSELDRIYQLRGELPEEVKALEDKLEELEGKKRNICEKIAAGEREIADQKQAGIQCRDLVEKYKAQLDAGVQNSREYDSLSKEMDYQDLQAQVADKNVGKAEEALVESREALARIEEKIEVKKADLEAKHVELEQIATSTAKQEEKLLAKRKENAEKIDARTMNAYERIRSSVRNGIAVAMVYKAGDAPEESARSTREDKSIGACGGCHSEVSPQRLIDIELGKKLVICEYCGRILVSESILEAE